MRWLMPSMLRRSSLFTAAERGDLATLDGLFADTISAHIAGNHPLAGDYQGKEAVFGFFARLAERSGGTARLHPQEALVDDWFAVALVEPAGRVGGETLDGERAVLVLRIQDGRFVELWSHHYDQHKMNRAWS
jgi:ketosteroid isomerase-like protein